MQHQSHSPISHELDLPCSIVDPSPKDNTLPLRKFFKTVPIRCFWRQIPVKDSVYSPLLLSNSCPSQCLFAAPVVEFLQVQVSDCSPPPSNSCKSKSVTVCRLRRTPASQCQFAASVKFLQFPVLFLPPPLSNCRIPQSQQFVVLPPRVLVA